jgi:Mg2+ and Co2+ transporter CorA
MMARGDAWASLQLAKSAQQDTSSMEVIAIMTMVFLPGTFFATLFSVPSLNWNSSPVIQDNFWVYWAFVLPCTALVLILWWWFKKREQIMFSLGQTESEKIPAKRAAI